MGNTKLERGQLSHASQMPGLLDLAELYVGSQPEIHVGRFTFTALIGVDWKPLQISQIELVDLCTWVEKEKPKDQKHPETRRCPSLLGYLTKSDPIPLF